jgi:hypothetical protein
MQTLKILSIENLGKRNVKKKVSNFMSSLIFINGPYFCDFIFIYVNFMNNKKQGTKLRRAIALGMGLGKSLHIAFS